MLKLLILIELWLHIGSGYSREARNIYENQIDSLDVKKSNVNNAAHIPKLISHPKCKSDLVRLCGSQDLNNIAVLDCVQNLERDDSAFISEECHHVLWSFKSNITQDNRISDFVKEYCLSGDGIFAKCSSEDSNNGNFISCMMQNANNLKGDCRESVIQIGTVVFSDYRYVRPMMENCKNDIEKFSCGRVQANNNKYEHSQGWTIECLSNHQAELEHNCKAAITKLAKLQSRNFRWDRAFFFACKEDKTKFCPRVRNDEGVFNCLMRHRNDVKMSDQCAEQLTRRMQLIVSDYEVANEFNKFCGKAIRENQCLKGTSSEDDDKALPIVLECLNKALDNGVKIKGKCRDMIIFYRTMMLNEAPSLIMGCKSEIRKFCSEEKGPFKIHCLIRYARKKNHNIEFSDMCQSALEKVIKVSNPAEDWEVDPVLHDACLPIYNSKCNGLSAGDGRVIHCLMDHITSADMIPECKAALIEIEYFVSRNWRLDPQLFMNCRSDAEKVCHAKNDWSTPDKALIGPDADILVLPCLFRYAYNPTKEYRLNRVCERDVRRVMEERAAFVELQPQIERECFQPLSTLCSHNTSQGAEMSCLQNNFEKLEGSCKLWIQIYINAERKDIKLNNPIMTFCTSVIKQICEEEFEGPEGDDGAVLDCLISKKHTPILKDNLKCVAAIENFQLITLKDIELTPRFHISCAKDLNDYCPGVVGPLHKRREKVDCLAQRLLHSILTDEGKLSEPCTRQLRRQLSHRHENVKLDPELKSVCAIDIQRFCQSPSNKAENVLECLRKFSSSLNTECHEIVFKREQIESADPEIDFVFKMNCGPMLSYFCKGVKPTQMIPCLVRNRNNPDFDQGCERVLSHRMQERSKDIRLNPMLYRACKDDAKIYCRKEWLMKGSVERNGKIIECLKEQLKSKTLNSICELKVIQITKLAALDYKLDPILNEKCGNEMKVLCSSKAEENSKSGEMEECLKLAFEQNTISDEECKSYVTELMQRERADIHIDPILYRACANDDTAYCNEMKRGEHLGCLLDLLNRNPSKLSRSCREKLRERREMFQMALKFGKVETINELVEGVRVSPNRSYLLVILFSLIGVIFLFGITCGRVTKRNYTLMKNK